MKFAKKEKFKIKFQKMKGTFLDNIPWMESHLPPLVQNKNIEKIENNKYFLPINEIPKVKRKKKIEREEIIFYCLPPQKNANKFSRIHFI